MNILINVMAIVSLVIAATLITACKKGPEAPFLCLVAAAFSYW